MSTPPNPKDEADEFRKTARTISNHANPEARAITFAVLALTAELRCVRETLERIADNR